MVVVGWETVLVGCGMVGVVLVAAVAERMLAAGQAVQATTVQLAESMAAGRKVMKALRRVGALGSLDKGGQLLLGRMMDAGRTVEAAAVELAAVAATGGKGVVLIACATKGCLGAGLTRGRQRRETQARRSGGCAGIW